MPAPSLWQDEKSRDVSTSPFSLVSPDLEANSEKRMVVLTYSPGSPSYFAHKKAPRYLNATIPERRQVYLNIEEADSMGSANDLVRCIWGGYVDTFAPKDGSEISKVESTLEHLAALCRVGSVDAAVDRCFEVIENAFAAQDLLTVEEMLSGADPSKLDCRVTVGMLRATSRAKDRLKSSWGTLLLKEQARLRLDNRNEKRILRGLVIANADSSAFRQSIT